MESSAIVGFEAVALRLDDVNARLDRMSSRFDNLTDLAGAAHRDHEQRIRRLEDRVGIERDG
jgi:hypothetical protein